MAKKRRIQDWSPSPHRAMLQAVLDEFLQAYLEAALWSSTDENELPLDDRFGIEDFSEEALKQATEDAIDFLKANEKDLEAAGSSWGYHGHDFWLSRNGHGAGFFDRDYGAAGDRLQEAAKVYGSLHIIEGGDGKLDFM